MKYEFGCCTKRLSLCLRFSSAGNGCSKSLASYFTKRKNKKLISLRNESSTVEIQTTLNTIYMIHEIEVMLRFQSIAE